MSRLELTGDQRRALDLDRPTAVVAAAGSGKTRTLTERFLAALERVADRPSSHRRVVALTFTRKATQEMRARIRSGIRERLREAARAGDKERVSYWRRIRDLSPRLRVSTIDAFQHALLAERPLEAGVDPDLEILDAPNARILAQETVRTLLAGIARSDPEANAPSRALAALCGFYRRWEIERSLTELLLARDIADRWLTDVDALPETAARVARVREAYEVRARQAVEEMAERLDTGGPSLAARAAAVSTRAREVARAVPDDKLVPCIAHVEAVVAAAGAHAHADVVLAAGKPLLRGNGYPRSFSSGRRGDWGDDDVAEARAVAGAMARIHSEELASWYTPFEEEIETRGVEIELALATLTRAALARYAERLGHGRRADFASVALTARDLVSRPATRRRIVEEIDFLLVDEFQDTSPLQWAFLERLLVDPDDPEGPPAMNPFFVGDEKQAIYEFRGGRVEVFRRAISRICAWGGTVVNLEESFRGLPTPIGLVNDVFGSVFRADARRPFEAAPQALRAMREGTGTVELLLTDPASFGDRKIDADTEREFEADRIAARVRSLVDESTPIHDPATGALRAVTYGDIAVVVFYKRLFANLENAFRGFRIPHRVLGGIGFFQTDEVRDVLTWLRALTDPGDDIACAALCRSVFFGFSDPKLYEISRRDGASFAEKLGDDGATIEAMRKRLGREPTSALLSDVLESTGYRAVAGAREEGPTRVANLEKLLNLVRTFETREGIRPVRLTRWLADHVAEVPDEAEAQVHAEADAVEIQTIHAAKGTEHPVVVVPGLIDDGQRMRVVPLMLRRDLDGASVAPKVPIPAASYTVGNNDSETLKTAAFRLTEREARERDRAQDKRVLYVAATRARDLLILSTRTPKATSARERHASPKLGRWTALDWLTSHPAIEEAISRAREGTEPHPIRTGDGSIVVRPPEPIERPAPEHELAVAKAAARLLARGPQLGLFEGPAGPTADGARDAATPAVSFVRARSVTAIAAEAARVPDGALAPLGGRFADGDAAGGGTGLGNEVHRRVAILTRPADGDAHRSDDEAGAHVRAFLETSIAREALEVGSQTEVSFVVPEPGGVLEGTIDRLHRAPDGTWTITDVKTNRIGDADLDDVARSLGHDDQVRLYAAAVARIHGLAARDRIRTAIVYTDPTRSPARDRVRIAEHAAGGLAT